ncbi:MAG: DUF934 domain-containing protein [Proteobacteria bacterium]|nr:DUF934 domain-containing protein [Pseudomonadota bacterium]
MKLLDRTGYRTDPYRRDADAELSDTLPLVPVGELDAALEARNGQIGVEVPNTQAIEALIPHFDRLSLVAIAFPAFSDGRGFSIARRLRQAGFTGTLRAVGPLIADQFAYALACGFDEIELPDASAERQPVELWQKAAGIMSAGYQRGYATGPSILEQRRAARRAAQ